MIFMTRLATNMPILYEKMAAGAFLGALVGAFMYMRADATSELFIPGVDTTYLRLDAQFAECIIGIQEYTMCQKYIAQLARIANDMVKTYTVFVNSQHKNLKDQVTMQTLHNEAIRVQKELQDCAKLHYSFDVDVVREYLSSYDAIAQTYLDNMYTDATNNSGGDLDKFDEIFAHAQVL